MPKHLTPLFILLCALASAGCDEAIKTEGPSETLQSCCQAAAGRIATVNDVESLDFRKRCDGCRKGNTSGQCESSATKVQSAVAGAFRDDWPIECTTLRSGLAAHGISIPQIR